MDTQKKIDALYQELPEVFSLQKLPESEDSDWIILSPDNLDFDGLFQELFESQNIAINNITFSEPLFDLSVFGANIKKPGSPVPLPERDVTPPPDALAFYLPFHEYYPDKWGIYISLEGIFILAQRLIKLYPTKPLPDIKFFPKIAMQALFYHEAYHSAVESFATKLELTHMKKIYVTAFNDYYAKTADKDDCLEEALANVKLISKTFDYINNNVSEIKEKNNLLEALLLYIKGNPPGYRKAYDIYTNQQEQEYQLLFIDNLMKDAFSYNYRSKEIWTMFTHALTPLIRIDQVCYLINSKSMIWNIVPKHIRSIRYKELIKKLSKLKNIKLQRQGKGSHVIWQSSSGKRIPIPIHTKDIPVGTVMSILKELNLKMSFSQFLSI